MSSLWSEKWLGEKGVLLLTQYYPKYFGFRITDGLLCYNGVNCNWILILEDCFRFVAHRVESNLYAVGGSSCVPISHWLREEEVKKLQKLLAVNSYASSVCKTLLSECPDVRTHGYRPFTV